MATVTEVAPNVFRIATFAPAKNVQFNQFLVVDEEPLLFHTGQKPTTFALANTSPANEDP